MNGMNNYEGSQGIVDPSKYGQYVRYQLATTKISEEEQEVLNKLEGDVELQAQYLKTIENAKREKEVFDEVDRQHKKKVRNVNIFSFCVGLYLIMVFPVMYWVAGKINLEFINTIGAVGLTVFVTIGLIVVIAIRSFVLQYQAISLAS